MFPTNFIKFCVFHFLITTIVSMFCTLIPLHPSTSNQHPSQRCSTNDQRRNDNTFSYPEEMSPKTQMESTNTATRSSLRRGTLGITTPLQLMDTSIEKWNGWKWMIYCYCLHIPRIIILDLFHKLLFTYTMIR